MGRGRGRPPKNKRPDESKPRVPPAEAERAYAVGAAVEVRVNDDGGGFCGSWYEATVAAHLDGGRYLVAYCTLVDDNGEQLREAAAAADVRPRPPLPGSARPFEMYDAVEALHNEGWWAGIVAGVPPLPEQRYRVSFPSSREVIEFPTALLRPHREFRHGNWVPAAEANCGAKPLFFEGDKVEVSRSGGTSGGCWYPATVLKIINVTNFLVQYRYAGDDGELATEILDSMYIRPARTHFPMESVFRFRLSSKVDIFHDGKWWPGVVLEVSRNESGEKYVVKLKSQETGTNKMEVVENLTVDKTKLRPQCHWDGKKWISCSTKRPANRRGKLVSGKSPIYSVPSTFNSNDEISHESGSPNKRARKDAVLALGADSSLALTSPLKVPPPRSISVPSTVQMGLPKTAMSGKSAISGKQSLQLELSNMNRTKEPSIGEENQPHLKHAELRVFDNATATNVGDMLPITPKNLGSKSFCRTDDLKKKRKGRLKIHAARKLVDIPEIMQVKKRVVDFSIDETDHGLVLSEKSEGDGDKSHGEENKKQCGIGNVDVQNELPDESPYGRETCMDLAQQANNQGSHEYGDSGSSQLNIGNDLPQGEDIAAMRQPATKGSVANENSRVVQLPSTSTTTLENIADANKFSSDFQGQVDGNQPSKAAESATIAFSKNVARMEHDFDGQFAPLSRDAANMEQEFASPSSQRTSIVLDDVAVDPLPSTENCKVNMQDDVPREDGSAATVVCAAKGSLAATEDRCRSSGRTLDVLEGAPIGALNSTEDCGARIQNDVSPEDHAAAIVHDVTEGFPPFENSSITHQFICDENKQSIGGDDEITPISKNTVSTEHAYDGPTLRRHAIVGESIMGNEPAPNKDVPFVKSSSMWAKIEEMEIFRKLPQQPHFVPLLHHSIAFREGMALGLMVSFANLAESIERLHIHDKKSLFEEKMSSLVFLEANGFDVKPLQSRLETLLQIKNDQIELKREADSNRVDAQIDVLKWAILELQQSASLLHMKVESLLTQKKSYDSEISRLQKDADEVEKSYQSCEQRFNDVAAAPW